MNWSEIWGDHLETFYLFAERVSDNLLAIGPGDEPRPMPRQLAPGYTEADEVPSYRARIPNEHLESTLTPFQQQRLRVALHDAHRYHWSHTDARNPLCRTCVAIRLLNDGAMNNANWSDMEYSSGADAIANAQMWIIRYGNKPFPPADTSHVLPETDDTVYLDRHELDDLPRPEPLIDGALMRHTYALLVGRDSTYKSFLAVDWSLSLATGKPWQGRETQTVPVLYIAGEGAYGLSQRIDAWEFAWGEKVPYNMFTVRQSPVNLFRGGTALDELLDRIQCGEYGLVVIDTLATASSGANMAASDSGVVLANIERIKRATNNGAVLVVAHTQKSDLDTSGLHQIEDNADTVWHSAVDDGVITVTNRKQKDGPTSPPMRLQVRPVLDSLVIESASGPSIRPTSDSQAALLATLEEAFSESAGATKQELMMASGVPKSTFYRALNALLKSGQVVSDNAKTERFRIPNSHAIPTTSPTQSHPEEGLFRE